MLKLAMPEAQITATPMNGLILLTGTIASPDDAAEAERLVQAYVGKDSRIISRLKTATPLQVNLQVRIAEVNRSFVKQIGVNLLNRDSNSSGFVFGVASGRNAGTIADVTDAAGAVTGTRYTFNPGSQRTTLGLGGRVLGMDLLGAIDLGETLGQVSTLANPNLTALSGETATFLAGGEIPFRCRPASARCRSNISNMASACPTRPRSCPTAASRCASGPRCRSCRRWARSRSAAPRSPH